MSDDKKSTRKPSSQPVVEAPISKVVKVLASDLVPGVKMLYPGGKLIEVDSVRRVVETFPQDSDFSLIVIAFKNQPPHCYLALPPSETVYTYAS